MARTPSAPAIPEQMSASAASVLPGVALPTWAQAPAPAAPPEPAPVPTELAPAYATAAPLTVPEYADPVGADSDPDSAPYSLADLPATAFPPGTHSLEYGADQTYAEQATPNYPAVSPELLSTTAPLTLPGDMFGAEGLGDGIPDVLPATHHSETEEPKGRRVHPLILVLGIVALVAVGAFAAFVTPGFLVSQADDDTSAVVPAPHTAPKPPATPAPVTDQPATPDATVVFRRTDGYQAVTVPAATRIAAEHEQRLADLGLPGGIAFGYAKKGAHNQVVAAAPKPTSGPVANPAAFLTAWQKTYGVSGAKAVKTGQKGAVAKCGTATYHGTAGAACAFAGPQAYGTVWVPHTRAAAAAATIPGVVASIHVE